MRRPVEEAELGFQRGNTSFRLRRSRPGLNASGSNETADIDAAPRQLGLGPTENLNPSAGAG
jgi:hypothetical protein